MITHHTHVDSALCLCSSLLLQNFLTTVLLCLISLQESVFNNKLELEWFSRAEGVQLIPQSDRQEDTGVLKCTQQEAKAVSVNGKDACSHLVSNVGGLILRGQSPVMGGCD